MADPEAPVPTPLKPNLPPHPGALWKGKRTDELDVPPTPVSTPLKPSK